MKCSQSSTHQTSSAPRNTSPTRIEVKAPMYQEFTWHSTFPKLVTETIRTQRFFRLPYGFHAILPVSSRIPRFTTTQPHITARPSFRSPSSSMTPLDPQTTRTCSCFPKAPPDSLQPNCYPFVTCLRDTLLKITRSIFDPIVKLNSKYFGTEVRMPTFQFPQSIPSITSTQLQPFRHCVFETRS